MGRPSFLSGCRRMRRRRRVVRAAQPAGGSRRGRRPEPAPHGAVRPARRRRGRLHGLPASDFTGLAPGTAYYALDVRTSTYLGRASLVPSPRSYQAGVVVQDDGSYLIFHRPADGTWRAVQDGTLTTAAACARYHVSLPAAVLAVWHWGPRTCTPPLPPAARATDRPGQASVAVRRPGRPHRGRQRLWSWRHIRPLSG